MSVHMFNLEALKQAIKQRVADALGIQQSDPMTAVYKQKMQKWHNKYQAERKRHQETKSWLEFRIQQLNVLSDEIQELTEQLENSADNHLDKTGFRATLDGVRYVKDSVNTSE